METNANVAAENKAAEILKGITGHLRVKTDKEGSKLRKPTNKDGVPFYSVNASIFSEGNWYNLRASSKGKADVVKHTMLKTLLSLDGHLVEADLGFKRVREEPIQKIRGVLVGGREFLDYVPVKLTDLGEAENIEFEDDDELEAMLVSAPTASEEETPF